MSIQQKASFVKPKENKFRFIVLFVVKSTESNFFFLALLSDQEEGSGWRSHL